MVKLSVCLTSFDHPSIFNMLKLPTENVFKMAARKDELTRYLAVLFTLDELENIPRMDVVNEARGLIRRRQESGYFRNIVRTGRRRNTSLPQDDE